MKSKNNNLLGISFMLLSMFCLSINDITYKYLSFHFPVWESIFFRALSGSIIATFLAMYFGLDKLKTKNLTFMIGFNRRFSPMILRLKTLLQKYETPKSFIYTINPGYIPKNHWTQDPNIGGGRIIGEVCHFIDLLIFLSGSKVCNFTAISIGCSPSIQITNDKVIINLIFELKYFITIA